MPNDYRYQARGVAALLFVLCAASASAATIAVPAGGDLQAALEAAQPGDVIELQSGATYVGNFRLPVKAGAEFVTLRTGGIDDLVPGPGQRIHKSHAPLLAKIRSVNNAAALTTIAGAHHWRIELVEFQGNVLGEGDIIQLGASSTQTDRSQMPFALVFDRVYVHGEPAVGQKRGIALNSGSTQIVNSYFEDFKRVGQDAQAIAGWNGAGPYLIENNYTEAAAQNVIFGGDDPRVPNLVPSDITIRRNVFTKPLNWRNERWQVKNAFELKNARRVLIEGNIFENVWLAAQTGYAVLLKVANQSGRSPWCVVEDVTFQYNIIRHSGSGIAITGHDDNPVSQQLKRLRISHNLLYDIDRDRWGGHGHFIQMGARPKDVIIENNTVFHDGQVMSLYAGRTPTGGSAIEGVVFRNNTMRHNQYGVKGDSEPTGHGSFARYLPGIVFENNVLAGGPASQYPPGNYFPPVPEFEAQFIDIPGENFALIPGSVFSLTHNGPLGANLAVMQLLMNGFGVSPLVPMPPPDEPGSDSPMGVRIPGAR